MNRRDTLTAFVALGALPRFARSKPARRIARIGFVSFNRASGSTSPQGFVQGLRELGYVEGRDVVIDYRDAEGRPDRLAAFAAEFVALKLDLIVAPSAPAALAMKQATRIVPIVFAGAADPVADGLVASLARPGGNVTGLSTVGAELVGKRLELLKQAVPGTGRIAVLWRPAPGHTAEDMFKAADDAARSLGVQLEFVEARGPADFDRAFADMARAGTGALTVLPITTFFSQRKRIIEMAARSRLPAVYTTRGFVEDGGLMAYGADLTDLLRRAASYADRILKGARPSELPVEQATKFELAIHLGTARALGLTIPQSVLLSADALIG